MVMSFYVIITSLCQTWLIGTISEEWLRLRIWHGVSDFIETVPVHIRKRAPRSSIGLMVVIMSARNEVMRYSPVALCGVQNAAEGNAATGSGSVRKVIVRSVQKDLRQSVRNIVLQDSKF